MGKSLAVPAGSVNPESGLRLAEAVGYGRAGGASEGLIGDGDADREIQELLSEGERESDE